MGKLLFTEDELYSNRPYNVVEDDERQKAEAIKQCRYNIRALEWLHTVYFEKAERKLTTEEVLSHPVTIADAFRWYSSYQRKQFSENHTYEARELLRDAMRGESVCELISLHPQNLKTILWDYVVIQVAEKALKCWNDVLPFKTEPDQQGAEPVEGAPKIPGGFIGFCYRKICELPAETRSAFLAINSGDQTYYSYRDEWPKEYGKKILKPGDMISKAKRHYREQNKN